jgi:hypothetical protein
MPHSICAVSRRAPATRRMPHEERLNIGSLIGRRLLYVIDYDHIDRSLRRFEFET